MNPPRLVWVNNAGLNILVVDLGSQSVVATIPNPAAFDATTRTLISTLPLKNAPFEMLMAPDGLAAYILGDQTITFYGCPHWHGRPDRTGTYDQYEPVFIHGCGRLRDVVCLFNHSASYQYVNRDASRDH